MRWGNREERSGHARPACYKDASRNKDIDEGGTAHEVSQEAMNPDITSSGGPQYFPSRGKLTLFNFSNYSR